VPKHKTHSGAKKRFRITGSGKVLREQANRRHLFEGKPTTRTRRLAADVEVDANDRKAVRRMLGR
jgi:large subunit ribosomal protein L35